MPPELDGDRHPDSRIPAEIETQRPKSKIQRREEILRKWPMPEHCKTPCLSNIYTVWSWLTFVTLTANAVGYYGLEPIWAAIKLDEEGDDSLWADVVAMINQRLNTVMVVV